MDDSHAAVPGAVGDVPETRPGPPPGAGSRERMPRDGPGEGGCMTGQAGKSRSPQAVRGGEVVCFGPDRLPHPPRHMVIPAGRTVACPDCGMTYVRAPGWDRMTGASWPKTEE